MTSLTDDLLLLFNSVVVAGDANGVWKILLSKYERKTMASQHHTRGKLLAMKMERGESFDSYLARIQDVRVTLASMNSPVTDSELVFVVLEGLPAAYEIVVENLKSKPT